MLISLRVIEALIPSLEQKIELPFKGLPEKSFQKNETKPSRYWSTSHYPTWFQRNFNHIKKGAKMKLVEKGCRRRNISLFFPFLVILTKKTKQNWFSNWNRTTIFRTTLGIECWKLSRQMMIVSEEIIKPTVYRVMLKLPKHALRPFPSLAPTII